MKTKTKTKQKWQEERNNNTKHMPERDRGRALDRESLVYRQPQAIRYPPGSQLSRICTQKAERTFRDSGFSFSTYKKNNRKALDRESLVYGQPRAKLSHPIPPPGLQLSRICTQRHSIYKSVLSGIQVSLSVQSTPLGESLGRCNQRGSKTSQVCYSHPRCNLNLVRLFRFSLPLPVFGRLFLFLHPCGHKPKATFTYCAVSDPRVKYGGAPVPRDAK